MKAPLQFLARCLDPVHVGSGGYRLGRVDMSIVREPATGIPKIPGTTLAGAIRAYAEMAKAERPELPDVNEVFGHSEAQGMLRFYDAEIVFFPVLSNQGTIWITTKDRLRLTKPDDDFELRSEENVVPLKGLSGTSPVNLAWMLLQSDPAKPVPLPAGISSFAHRVVAVSDKLFHHLVNDNLEVRTSVEIDDQTGAAKGGHLFTYEAIPRGTVLRMEIYIDDRRGNTNYTAVEAMLKDCFAGLKLLGVGGMGTRGFGRIEILDGGAE